LTDEGEAASPASASFFIGLDHSTNLGSGGFRESFSGFLQMNIAIAPVLMLRV
jgi:hypothetical protein